MAVEIQEVEVVPAPTSPSAASGSNSTKPPTVLSPEVELELERAARLRHSRDLRLHAD